MNGERHRPTAAALAAPVELDVFGCRLDGVNQIEASAGTGKTWNICALYVRLMLERDLNADQILVVTFTKAATAELHERIRSRLAELERAIERRDRDGDPFIARLFETVLADADDVALELAAKRVRRALSTFDQAAIHTIHAFCQRALQEAPFAAGMPFSFEMQADDASLRFELAADFWRTRVEPEAAAHPAFAAWLVERGAGPAALDAQLAKRLKKPLARVRWGAAGASSPEAEAQADEVDAQARFDEACALWHAEREAIVQLLGQAQAVLSRTTHKPETVAAALDAWDRYFAQGDCHAAPPRAALKLTAAALAKATKVKCTPPEHPFFVLAQTLAAASESAEAAHRMRWLVLLAQWLDEAPAALRAMKRTRRVSSFDDLLANLHDALVAHPWLAEALRARYPAALIDEFQDTDPLQFAIFERIFAKSGQAPAPLFLVGDPKQAIYSFRAADLHTYLAARHAASARYTLAVNQRSTAPLVEACNRIFGANPQAFVLDGLDYQPVRAGTRIRGAFVDERMPARHGVAEGSFNVWMLPSGEDALVKRDAQRQAAEACAAEIAGLMRGAREGTVRVGAAPLAPADIAVLVRTHKQGSLVKHVLAAWGIGSVELAQASVFETIDAEQLERVLIAIDTPGDLRRLRAALAADWFGLDAAALWRLQALTDEVPATHEDDATAWVERFSRYRSLWHERGFAAMWRTLMRELGIGPKLIAGEDGERRLTDVNHLAELVAARDAATPGLAPTLRWLAAQRTQGGGEEAQLRLESDRDLVQIVTVHKSKGLEYAVVFCPFLNDGARAAGSSPALPDACEYHEAADAPGATVTVLHYGCEGETAERAAREAAREEAAERARLVYVALTRAVHRCYLVAGSYLSSRSTKESRRSVLNWLVAGDERGFDAWSDDPPEEAVIARQWEALTSPGGPIAIGPLPMPVTRAPLARESARGRRLAARMSRIALAESWRIASFSSLASAALAHAPLVAEEEPRPDHDALAAPPPEPALPAVAAGALPPAAAQADDILAFPRGAAAGECLHRLFELADFANPDTWPAAIARALQERPVAADAATARLMPAMMGRVVADVVGTELAPGLTLAEVDPERRFVEWPFLFAAPALALPALRRLLTAHGYPDVALEPGMLAGFVKGFVDMIVEHRGRYWIIDWKSNHLGMNAADYAAGPLEAAMTAHAYHLQGLLYTLALHRYLKVRKRGYDYDAHVGGYLYVFLRGVRPGWHDGGMPAGVHRRTPSRALIEALDRLMAGEARA
ncbi:exodeoxyribonuclease V subunit beta [Trinickia caryophylli]|uniref:RecBCD enzyme subunit RecB n=1 Tax=Trinickia caryophylli TaxID=28094 RepID=A0A1X7DY99_TRICW|nr:exodeoxyribonuclease V subunit beta [Trinickia caryophylli]PMS14160.1 exodeoxyribonuclease V subunit beta [Trinickia caryophylli]WQE11375.1 exodeoxyribonuclease V subunit beta [Trinickia caryophylli]GLU32533.1 RecBCD enzyme subunit RecB [Trinickia caryophylli]SMF23760.1 DNA helicase/exodeoxyribonuclease V, beta subunit [Trinickia caryophylli]